MCHWAASAAVMPAHTSCTVSRGSEPIIQAVGCCVPSVNPGKHLPSGNPSSQQRLQAILLACLINTLVPTATLPLGAPVQKCLTDVRDGCAGCVEVLLVLCRASFLAYACVQWPVVVLNLQRAFSSCLLSAMVRAQGPLLPHAVQACVLHRPVARDCRSLLTGHRADMSHP